MRVPTLPYHFKPWLHAADCLPVHLVKLCPWRKTSWTLSAQNNTQSKNTYTTSHRSIAVTTEYLLLSLSFPLPQCYPVEHQERKGHVVAVLRVVLMSSKDWLPHSSSQAAFSCLPPTEQKRFWSHCCHSVFLVAEMAAKHFSLQQTLRVSCSTSLHQGFVMALVSIPR